MSNTNSIIERLITTVLSFIDRLTNADNVLVRRRKGQPVRGE